MANLIEIHIIESYPSSNLVRNEDGTPKSGFFGGAQRARISPAALKRPMRLMLKEAMPNYFGGLRLKNLSEKLGEELKKLDVADAEKYANAVADSLGKNEDGGEKTKSLLYLSKMEIEAIAKKIADADEEELKKLFKIKKDKIEATKRINNVLKKAHPVDLADIALFGRMIVQDSSVNLEAASAFSNGLSVHATKNETNFIAALSDFPAENEQGSAHIGENYFNSATYYRAVVIDTNLLADEDHLAHIPVKERRVILAKAIEACIRAHPNGCSKNFLASTPVDYALGIVREKGQNFTLSNAFEKPLKSTNGYRDLAVKALTEEWKYVKKMYDGAGLGEIKTELTISRANPGLKNFCEGLVSHVW